MKSNEDRKSAPTDELILTVKDLASLASLLLARKGTRILVANQQLYLVADSRRASEGSLGAVSRHAVTGEWMVFP